MARKRMKFADGGAAGNPADNIVVTARRPTPGISDFDLGRVGGGGMGAGAGTGMGSAGGAGRGQRMGPATPVTPRNRMSIGSTNTGAGPVYGPRFGGDNFSIGAGLGKGVIGSTGAPIAGIGGTFRFKEGGKVKKPKTKKMAKGGSTASKRADGCATKGKTRGKFV